MLRVGGVAIRTNSEGTVQGMRRGGRRAQSEAPEVVSCFAS